MLQAWRDAIPGGHKLEKKNVVCDLHFSENNVIRHYISDVEDPKLKITTLRSTLVKGSIPSIFPTNKNNKGKESKKIIDIFSPPRGIKNFNLESNFKIIFKNCESIKLPNEFWIVQRLENCIMWSNWTENITELRNKVVLNSDMSIKVL